MTALSGTQRRASKSVGPRASGVRQVRSLWPTEDIARPGATGGATDRRHRVATAIGEKYTRFCRHCGDRFYFQPKPRATRAGWYCPGKGCAAEARRAPKRARYQEQKHELKLRRLGVAA
jgi:hypothetical protein